MTGSHRPPSLRPFRCSKDLHLGGLQSCLRVLGGCCVEVSGACVDTTPTQLALRYPPPPHPTHHPLLHSAALTCSPDPPSPFVLPARCWRHGLAPVPQRLRCQHGTCSVVWREGGLVAWTSPERGKAALSCPTLEIMLKTESADPEPPFLLICRLPGLMSLLPKNNGDNLFNFFPFRPHSTLSLPSLITGLTGGGLLLHFNYCTLASAYLGAKTIIEERCVRM